MQHEAHIVIPTQLIPQIQAVVPDVDQIVERGDRDHETYVANDGKLVLVAKSDVINQVRSLISGHSAAARFHFSLRPPRGGNGRGNMRDALTRLGFLRDFECSPSLDHGDVVTITLNDLEKEMLASQLGPDARIAEILDE